MSHWLELTNRTWLDQISWLRDKILKSLLSRLILLGLLLLTSEALGAHEVSVVSSEEGLALVAKDRAVVVA